MVELLSNWGRPIVALTDRQSRSARDALAYEFKQRKLATVVGERTAGAVIPASFEPLGDETVLMFPSFTLGDYTKKLELKGLEPDISVERAGPYSAGHDRFSNAEQRNCSGWRKHPSRPSDALRSRRSRQRTASRRVRQKRCRNLKS